MSKFQPIADNPKQFTVRDACQSAVQAVCRVFINSDWLTAEEKFHYVKMSGVNYKVDSAGNPYFTAKNEISKPQHYAELAKVLFTEPATGDIKWNVIFDATNFFFGSFGEITHTARTYLNGLESVQSHLNQMRTLNSFQPGEKDISESTE